MECRYPTKISISSEKYKLIDEDAINGFLGYGNLEPGKLEIFKHNDFAEKAENFFMGFHVYAKASWKALNNVKFFIDSCDSGCEKENGEMISIPIIKVIIFIKYN